VKTKDQRNAKTATAALPVSVDLERRRYTVGEQVRIGATGGETAKYEWSVRSLSAENDESIGRAIANRNARNPTIDTTALGPGAYELRVVRKEATEDGAEVVTESDLVFTVETDHAEVLRSSVEHAVTSGLPVTMHQANPTGDQALWSRMRMCLDRRSFSNYRAFVDRVLCQGSQDGDPCGRIERRASKCCYRHGVHGYAALKAATEVWLVCHACCGDVSSQDTMGLEGELTSFDPASERARLGYDATPAEMRERLRVYLESSVMPGTLPYIGTVLDNLGLAQLTSEGYPFCESSIRGMPCMIELWWSVCVEESMLVQSINAISRRFMNGRLPKNQLANLNIHPLKELNNLLWGYIQDEGNRLTIRRRASAYLDSYGVPLYGKAVENLEVAERRSKFLQAFHNLLYRAATFYRDAQNLMMKPDGYPLLQAIQAVHLLLAEGAHNQWGDLPSTARGEMLIQQWLMSRREMQDVLQTPAMVPYDEGWMGPVDAMKKIMGWTDVSVTHFHRLATFGEKILLTVRFDNWGGVNTTSEKAEAWARYWKPELQGYIAAYNEVTGVDLSAPLGAGKQVDAAPLSMHIARRLREQQGAAE
jgi:hypothetical protein